MKYEPDDIIQIEALANHPDAAERKNALDCAGMSEDLSPFRPMLAKLASSQEVDERVQNRSLLMIQEDCRKDKISCPPEYISLFQNILQSPKESEKRKVDALSCINFLAKNLGHQLDPTLPQLLISTAITTGPDDLFTSTISAMHSHIQATQDDLLYRSTVHGLTDPKNTPADPEIRKHARRITSKFSKLTEDMSPHVYIFEQASDVKYETNAKLREDILSWLTQWIKDTNDWDEDTQQHIWRNKSSASVFEPMLLRNLSYSAQRTAYETDDDVKIANAKFMVASAENNYNPLSYHMALAKAAHPVTGDKDPDVRRQFLTALNDIADITPDLAPYEKLLPAVSDPAIETEEHNRLRSMFVLGTLVDNKSSNKNSQTQPRMPAFAEKILVHALNPQQKTSNGIIESALGTVNTFIKHSANADPLKNHPDLLTALQDTAQNHSDIKVKMKARGVLKSYNDILAGQGIYAAPAAATSNASSLPADMRINFLTSATWDNTLDKGAAYNKAETNLKAQTPDAAGYISVTGAIGNNQVTVKIPKTDKAIDNLLSYAFNGETTKFKTLNDLGNNTFEGEPALRI